MSEESIIALLRSRGIEVDSPVSIINIWDETDEYVLAFDGRLDIKKTITSSNEAVRSLLENLIDDKLIGGISDNYLERLPSNLRSAQMNNQEAHEHWSDGELSEAIYHLTFALQGIIVHLEESWNMCPKCRKGEFADQGDGIWVCANPSCEYEEDRRNSM